jgi:hypothetical protein
MKNERIYFNWEVLYSTYSALVLVCTFLLVLEWMFDLFGIKKLNEYKKDLIDSNTSDSISFDIPLPNTCQNGWGFKYKILEANNSKDFTGKILNMKVCRDGQNGITDEFLSIEDCYPKYGGTITKIVSGQKYVNKYCVVLGQRIWL